MRARGRKNPVLARIPPNGGEIVTLVPILRINTRGDDSQSFPSAHRSHGFELSRGPRPLDV